jgi:hypothetical protein
MHAPRRRSTRASDAAEGSPSRERPAPAERRGERREQARVGPQLAAAGGERSHLSHWERSHLSHWERSAERVRARCAQQHVRAARPARGSRAPRAEMAQGPQRAEHPARQRRQRARAAGRRARARAARAARARRGAVWGVGVVRGGGVEEPGKRACERDATCPISTG